MNENECNVCTRLIKEKYRYYNTWRALAIVFMCLTVLFAILYFSSGDAVKTTTIEYNNEVDIENGGNNNTNTNNGNITVEKENDNSAIAIIVIISILLVGGGALLGGHFMAQVSLHNKQQGHDNKWHE